MSRISDNYQPWPAFRYEEFQPSAYLLHMCIQAIGKLTLIKPFEPHWANVPLWLTSRGLTSGLISYGVGAFSVDMDLIDHQIICATSWGEIAKIKLAPMSVAELIKMLFNSLHDIGVEISVNPQPQEVENPIAFNEDTNIRPYNRHIVTTWWQIMISTHRVLERYHARFTGRTPPIGLMWGTLDLRDARYKGTPVPTTGINAGYIRRNAMDDAQVEAGFWAGSKAYPRAAFFSFTFPEPSGIAEAAIKPNKARFDKTLGEFILDYDDLLTSTDPENDLLSFFESTYQAGAERANWKSTLIGKGVPV